MRPMLVLTVLLAAGLAGCADDPAAPGDDGDGGSTASPTASPSPSPSPSPEPRTLHVTIQDVKFQPADLTVEWGDTVVWTNQDGGAHTVVSTDGGPLDSGTLQQGDTYSYTFDGIGTFEYRCDLHPSSMTGSIRVQVDAE